VKIAETDMEFTSSTENMENIEKKIISEFSLKNQADFNRFLPSLMNALSMEKNEEEKNAVFENRLVSELKNCLEIRDVL